jgi:poly-gamma-glutamate synthesis protein (capsule biosynthesis protein)
LQEAQKLLGQAGIATVGAGADFNQAHAPVILERNGLRLAFLGYVNVPEELDGFNALDWVATAAKPGVAWADPVQMAVDIQAARKQADLVVVLLHAGLEIGEYMSIVSGDQRAAAHAAIDAGAAVVIGSHPHQLEPLELYHGGLIAYSLGNFVFDDYHGIANATVILQVSLDRTGFEGYKIIPALIRNGLPELIPENQLPAIATLVAPMPTAGH